MSYFLHALLTIAIVCSAAPAFADDYEDTFNSGTALFKNKEYANARGAYLRAYEIRKESEVLFAVAQTYRYEGNFKEAISWYRKFLADSQSAQDLRTEAETYLKESVARQDAIDDSERKANTKPAGPASVPTPPVDQGERKRQIPLSSKIVAGVAGAGVVASVLFTLKGKSVEGDFIKAREAGTATLDDSKRVDRYQDLINISWGVTGAAAITAVVIYFAAPSYATDRKNIAIAPTRDGGWSAAFTARF